MMNDPDEDGREDPADVVDRFRGLVHMSRNEPNRHEECEQRERERHEEHGSPVEELEENTAMSGPSSAMPPPRADQSAIDFVRAWPDQSAVMRASVVGYARPAESPPTTRAPKRTVSDGANPATIDAGIGEDHAEHDHQLPPVPVTKRSEPENRGGETQRVADCDEVESRL